MGAEYRKIFLKRGLMTNRKRVAGEASFCRLIEGEESGMERGGGG